MNDSSCSRHVISLSTNFPFFDSAAYTPPSPPDSEDPLRPEASTHQLFGAARRGCGGAYQQTAS